MRPHGQRGGGPILDELLDDLNEAQRAAVLHGPGPLLVIAGAGSGKTRVITRRVARLLRDGVHPDEVLALTFTNKAAGEMARRVNELGGRRVRVATFHSSCARWLRADAELLDFPKSFSIYDTYDRDACLKGLLEELGLQGLGVKPAAVGRRISMLKNHRLTPQTAELGIDEADHVVRQVFEPYQRRMQKLGAMDFDDLLNRFLDLLEQHPGARQKYQERFSWVLVDEFQDTNLVQYQIARALSERTRNLCVVGDPDQSIYKFRGAEIRNILEFDRDHPDATTIKLEVNYRSTKTILRAAEAVIENNVSRKQKRLRTGNEDGERLRACVFDDEQAEAREVGQSVAELVRSGVAPSQIAVFYRAHYLSRGLEQSLRQLGIAYEVVGGLSFFERREIKDVIAYLRAATNPLDDVAAERVINVPPRGLGHATLEKLRTAAARNGVSLAEAAGEPALHAGLSRKARAGLEEFAAIVEAARETGRTSAERAVRVVLERSGYVQYACSIGDPDDVAREENVMELLNDATVYDREERGGLAGYLAYVSLLTSEDRRAQSGPTVTLMTIHAAKGLEFDHVFLCGLEEGLFPSARAMTEDGDVEEERRLMYVALTRARKTVQLSRAEFRMVNGETLPQVPSRFLAEVPEDVVTVDAPRWRNVRIVPETDFPDLRPGTRVRHAEFGEGSVRRVAGAGISTRAVVAFDDGGERTLLLEYADLEVIGGDDFGGSETLVGDSR